MPEDVTHELKAFTPAGLDRDAVLFAAGKAAGRRWAGWKWLAVGLLASNAVSLGVLFWPKPVANPSPAVIEPPVSTPPTEAVRPDPFSYIALRQGWDAPPVQDIGPPATNEPLSPRAIHDAP